MMFYGSFEKQYLRTGPPNTTHVMPTLLRWRFASGSRAIVKRDAHCAALAPSARCSLETTYLAARWAADFDRKWNPYDTLPELEVNDV